MEVAGLQAEFVRSRRRTISIQILSDLRIRVRAPHGTTEAFVHDFLERRRDWIEKHRTRLAALRSEGGSLRWASGEALHFLGERLELKVESGSRATARLGRTCILVKARDPSNPVELRRAVERLYAREAAERFPARLDACLQRISAFGLPRPALRCRSMSSRWGSCDATRKVITLNTKLLRFQPEIIEYVIMHELAHFRHRGHDAAFYSFLAKLCPEWKERRAFLKGRGAVD